MYEKSPEKMGPAIIIHVFIHEYWVFSFVSTKVFVYVRADIYWDENL